MEIGICGPIDIEPLRGWLDGGAAPLPRGLGGTPVTDLARAALAAGWRVHIFTLDADVRQEVLLHGPQLTLQIGPFRARHRARDLFAAERAYLSQAIRKAKPEIVHAHWTYEFALGALDSGAPTVVTAHDSPLRVLRFNPTPYRLMRTIMAWQTACRVKHLTAVSPNAGEHFRRYFRYAAPIAIIPNGIMDEWFQDGRAAAKAGTGIVFAGVLNGWGDLKNGKTLLEAFRLVRRKLPDCQLSLFGAGHGLGEDAETWARRNGLSQNVSFRGTVARQALREELKQNAQIMVHPSLEESFGMTVAEAMALGIPVIAGSAGGAVAGTLDNGRSGVLTDVRSPHAMAAEMLRLAVNPSLREQIALQGAASAGNKFRMNNVLAAYAEIYREAKKG
jgi:glycosyltransferase involved in cell wall biosynthesis